jgi:hypothetical protein
MFSEKDWALYNRPRSSMVIVLVGSSMLAVLQILISAWLGIPILSGAQIALGLTTLFSALAVMLIEWGEDFFEHPLPIPGSISSASKANSARVPRPVVEPPAPVSTNPVSAVTPPASSEIPKTQESRKSDEEDDLIMLELD